MLFDREVKDIPNEEVSKPCLLCSRTTALSRSHFISSADIVSCGRKYATVSSGGVVVLNSRSLRRWTKFLFCERCEGYFSSNFESVVPRNSIAFSEPPQARRASVKVPLLNSLNLPVSPTEQATIEVTDLLLRYFLMTIWRTLVKEFPAVKEFPHADPRGIDKKKFMEVLRFLLHKGHQCTLYHKNCMVPVLGPVYRQRFEPKVIPQMGIVISKKFVATDQTVQIVAAALRKVLDLSYEKALAPFSEQIVVDMLNNEVVELHCFGFDFFRHGLIPAAKLGSIWLFWVLDDIACGDFCHILRPGSQVTLHDMLFDPDNNLVGSPVQSFNRVFTSYCVEVCAERRHYSSFQAYRERLEDLARTINTEGGDLHIAGGGDLDTDDLDQVPNDILLQIIENNQAKLNFAP